MFFYTQSIQLYIFNYYIHLILLFKELIINKMLFLLI